MDLVDGRPSEMPQPQPDVRTEIILPGDRGQDIGSIPGWDQVTNYAVQQ